jgi:hypothetical protein
VETSYHAAIIGIGERHGVEFFANEVRSRAYDELMSRLEKSRGELVSLLKG